MADVECFVTDTPAPADVALIESSLRAFNVERVKPYDRRALCVFVRDAEGRTLGGLTGFTNWGWLYVDYFWLPEELRHGGLGARLIAAAEAQAVARGCIGPHLSTYSFQARGFYEKQGYAVFGILDDYPPGHAVIHLRKDLVTERKPCGPANL